MTAPIITVEAGRHHRRWCPVEFRLPQPLSPGSHVLDSGDGAVLQAEALNDGRILFVLPELSAGESRSYRIESAGATDTKANVTLTDSGGDLSISLHGELVTRYVYGDVPARPYFYPVHAPGQIPVTRAYPMEQDAAGETRDHPHHRSLWIAHGEVNDADNWSEEPSHAHTRHQEFGRITGGRVAGSFASTSLWTKAGGEPLLTQDLAVTVWATGGDFRLLDFGIKLSATHGDVHFGDTKEGGILSVRVASALDVPRTGTITNVYGGTNEAETWGRAAHWCDYSGTNAGSPVGIAIMDHPHSFRYPTHWHVRNYGLMTANPFAYAAYTNGEKDGSHTLKSGEALAFRYRVVLHAGSCSGADVNGRYLDFVAPPKVLATP